MRRPVFIFVSLLVLLGHGLAIGLAGENRAVLQLLTDPPFDIPQAVSKFDLAAIPLWRESLKRPEADYRRLAADSVARAHVLGMPGLDVLTPELVAVIKDKEGQSDALHAAARALIALQATSAAGPLFDLTNHPDAAFRLLIEPVLADWKYAPAIEAWNARLNAKAIRRRELLLAAECLARSRQSAAAAPLAQIALDVRRPVDVRLACARAAGDLATAGMEPQASSLLTAKGAPLIARLCAVGLLTRHTSAAAQDVLKTLATDGEPAVAAGALGALHAISPELVIPFAPGALKNGDALVRLRGVESYVSLPTIARLEALAPLLDDVHMLVRARVCEALIEHAKSPEFDPVIRAAAMQVLAAESWRGQEQATLLLTELDHKPAAPRMVELLESSRKEVLITAAWGLRRLAVRDTLPAMLDKANRQTDARKKGVDDALSLDYQVAHLFEAFAVMKYTAAVSLMTQYVAKVPALGEFSRAAAIRTLGILNEDKPDAVLAGLMMGRAQDIAGMPPETELLRQTCIIAIGRMRSKPQAAAIRALSGDTIEHTPIEYAYRWAYDRLTEEKLPLGPVPTVLKDNWTIKPYVPPEARPE